MPHYSSVLHLLRKSPALLSVWYIRTACILGPLVQVPFAGKNIKTLLIFAWELLNIIWSIEFWGRELGWIKSGKELKRASFSLAPFSSSRLLCSLQRKWRFTSSRKLLKCWYLSKTKVLVLNFSRWTWKNLVQHFKRSKQNKGLSQNLR